MERTHDEMKSLIAPYVLGAVPADEVAEIRTHIVTCDECMAEAERYADAAASLAAIVDPEELPQGFADRVVAAALGPKEETAPGRRGSWWRIAAVGAYAVLLVAIVALTAVLVDTRDELEANRHLAGALLEGANGVELQGSDNATAKVIAGEKGSILVVKGLSEAPGGRTYQLWFIRGENPVSAGTFDVTSEVEVFRTQLPFRGHDAAAVTIEPAGGSRRPTTKPILSSA